MFSRIKGFLSRHKRKFIVGGLLVGGTVLVTRYAQKKLREWQERETKEFLDRTRRQHHFESTERTCNQTILSLAPLMREVVTKSFSTEDLVSRLRSSPTDKVALWEELKILAFTRASVLVYASAMLVITLRIQLNLIGGYMYQDSTNKEITKQSCITSLLQQKYLSLCHHFMNEGVPELCTLLENKIRLIVEGTSLKQHLTLQDTEQIFWAVQALVASEVGDPVKSLARYILPGDKLDSLDSLTGTEICMLNKMIVETTDLLESDEVVSLTTSSVSRGFSLVVDKISEYFSPVDSKTALNTFLAVPDLSKQPGNSKLPIPGYNNGVSSFVHPSQVAMPMAKLIPIVNGLVHHQAGLGDVPDVWMQQLILNDKLKLLGANVYEVFSHQS